MVASRTIVQKRRAADHERPYFTSGVLKSQARAIHSIAVSWQDHDITSRIRVSASTDPREPQGSNAPRRPGPLFSRHSPLATPSPLAPILSLHGTRASCFMPAARRERCWPCSHGRSSGRRSDRFRPWRRSRRRVSAHRPRGSRPRRDRPCRRAACRGRCM